MKVSREGLKDERNKKFMAMGYPPGPPREVAKKLNLRDINTYMKLHEEFGDIFMLPLGDVPLVVTRSPDHIRELLGGSATERFPRPKNVIQNIEILFGRAQIALDGEEHQANKRMLSQWLFSSRHNAKMIKPFHKIANAFLGQLEKRMDRDGEVEAYEVAELAAADVSAALSFGKSYDALVLGHCRQLEALKTCDKIFLNRAMNKNWKNTEPPEVTKQFNECRQVIADTFQNAFNNIKKDPTQFDHNIMEHMLENNLRNRSAQCPMGNVPTEFEAITNMIGFLAGVGNSARMNTIGIEMLARYPEFQENVLLELHRKMNVSKLPLEEIKQMAKKGVAVPGSADDRLFSYKRIMSLDYLRCFMHECLRLYTPSTSVAPRACSSDSPLGEYTIPQGTNVMCNIYGSHRHPDFWENHEKFDPLRFDENEGVEGDPNTILNCKLKSLIPQGFFPFGYGGHGCIGKNLAQEVTTMMWAMLIANYEIKTVPTKPVAEFNTLKSDQILGFIEAVNGSYITMRRRQRNVDLDDKASKILRDIARKEEKDEAEMVEFSELDVDLDREWTMAEVKQHTTRETGVWFIIHKKVYDATKWLKDHPGGADVLLKSAGKDVTRVFELTNHSSFAVKEAEKYCIGRLKEDKAKL